MQKGVAFAVVGLLLAGVGAAAYYQEPLQASWIQQAWNPGASVEVVQSFVRYATQPDSGPAAARLLDSTVLTPVVAGAHLLGVRQGASGMAAVVPIRKIVPTGDIRGTQTDLLTKNGGAFRVLIQYRDGRWGEFRVHRRDGVRTIFQVPSELSATPPVRGKFE